MRTIVHLSDLHFGRVDEKTLAPLCDTVWAQKPDVVAISGDLTQRAKPEEFQLARHFLDALPEPVLVVPGNHDVPVFGRLREPPMLRYETHITKDLEPHVEDEEICVAGLNTARAFAIQGGRLSHGQIALVKRRFTAARTNACKVLVAHHPLDVPGHWVHVRSARRSKRAFEEWSECGVDLILGGHEHRSHATDQPELLRHGKHQALMVQAGTATSTRVRGEPNSFNTIHIEPGQIVVVRLDWDGKGFREAWRGKFART